MPVPIDIPDADHEALLALASYRRRSVAEQIHSMISTDPAGAVALTTAAPAARPATDHEPGGPPSGPDAGRRRQRLQAMATLQDRLNTQVHPEWRQQGHAYYRAIWVECGELLDHHGWKWWTEQEPDFRQIHLELVDIWHFGLSELIRDHHVDDRLADRFGAALAADPEWRPIPELVETFALRTLANRSFALEPFAALMRATGLSETDLYRMYLAKNVLNAFRLARGYRTGDYRKHWHDGREDNAHLADLAAGLDPDAESFSDDLRGKLAGAYQKTLDGAG